MEFTNGNEKQGVYGGELPSEEQNVVTRVCVTVRDARGWWLGRQVSYDAALTLCGIVSEDPHDWHEVALLWPRYRTRVVAEYFSSLDFEESTQAESLESINESAMWLHLDLEQKRLCTGGEFLDLGDAGGSGGGLGTGVCLSLDAESDRGQGSVLCIHLPPWWECDEQVSPATVLAARRTSLEVPKAYREILWGNALVEDLANRILTTFKLNPELSHTALPRESLTASRGTSELSDREYAQVMKLRQERYPHTVSVHRDWLMTARDDLGGQTPRECLHGAMDWIDQLCDDQKLRISSADPCVALPKETVTYQNAPPGRDEVCTYFDLCRELIDAGWDWCCHPATNPHGDEASKQLEVFLSDVQQAWMDCPLEGDSPPRVIVECNRRRVVRGQGFTVEGMGGEEQAAPHVMGDCNCPICDMTADGMFGPSFWCIDGHHLELDDEFAFSLWRTHEEWERERWVDNPMSLEDAVSDTPEGLPESLTDDIDATHLSSAWGDGMDQSNQGRVSRGEDDEFDSVWQSLGSHTTSVGGIYLTLGFMLSEIISVLNDGWSVEEGALTESHSSKSDASDHQGCNKEEIASRLCELLRQFRRAGSAEKVSVAETFKDELEHAATVKPELLSRVADFQSRLDEVILAGESYLSQSFDRDAPF